MPATDNEPPHIHVERDDAEAIFWLTPVHLENSFGFNRKEINKIQGLIENYRELFMEKWNEFFSR
jgi:hypothetical protein